MQPVVDTLVDEVARPPMPAASPIGCTRSRPCWPKARGARPPFWRRCAPSPTIPATSSPAPPWTPRWSPPARPSRRVLLFDRADASAAELHRAGHLARAAGNTDWALDIWWTASERHPKSLEPLLASYLHHVQSLDPQAAATLAEMMYQATADAGFWGVLSADRISRARGHWPDDQVKADILATLARSGATPAIQAVGEQHAFATRDAELLKTVLSARIAVVEAEGDAAELAILRTRLGWLLDQLGDDEGRARPQAGSGGGGGPDHARRRSAGAGPAARRPRPRAPPPGPAGRRGAVGGRAGRGPGRARRGRLRAGSRGRGARRWPGRWSWIARTGPRSRPWGGGHRAGGRDRAGAALRGRAVGAGSARPRRRRHHAHPAPRGSGHPPGPPPAAGQGSRAGPGRLPSRHGRGPGRPVGVPRGGRHPHPAGAVAGRGGAAGPAGGLAGRRPGRGCRAGSPWPPMCPPAPGRRAGCGGLLAQALRLAPTHPYVLRRAAEVFAATDQRRMWAEVEARQSGLDPPGPGRPPLRARRRGRGQAALHAFVAADAATPSPSTASARVRAGDGHRAPGAAPARAPRGHACCGSRWSRPAGRRRAPEALALLPLSAVPAETPMRRASLELRAAAAALCGQWEALAEALTLLADLSRGQARAELLADAGEVLAVRAGDVPAAVAAFRAALEADPQHREAREALERWQVAEAGPAGEDGAIDQARAARRAGDWGRHDAVLAAAADREVRPSEATGLRRAAGIAEAGDLPPHRTDLQVRAFLAAQTPAQRAAVTAQGAAARGAGEAPGALRRHLAACLEAGRLDEAREAAQQLLALEPRSLPAALALCRVAALKGEAAIGHAGLATLVDACRDPVHRQAAGRALAEVEADPVQRARGWCTGGSSPRRAPSSRRSPRTIRRWRCSSQKPLKQKGIWSEPSRRGRPRSVGWPVLRRRSRPSCWRAWCPGRG
ncbi:MAG: hypothetical protein R3F43_26050 [bacterium]